MEKRSYSDWAVPACASLGFLMIAAYLVHKYRGGDFFWDLQIYLEALSTRRAGGDSYGALNSGRFVYSPLVLRFMSLIEAWLAPLLVVAYAGLGVAFLTLKEGRFFLLALFLSVFCFFNFGFAVSVQTGNITTVVHFAVLLVALASFSRGPGLFLGVVVLAAIIKPYFLSYLLLGLVIWPMQWRYLLASVAAVAAVVAVFGLQRVLLPVEFDQFVSSLQAQALGNGDGPGRDVGRAPYYFLGSFLGKEIGLVLHVACVALLGGLFVLYQSRIGKLMPDHDRTMLLFWFALIVCILINPRMKVYDWWVLQAACCAVLLLHIRYRFVSPLVLLGLATVFFMLWVSERLTGTPSGFSLRVASIYTPIAAMLVFGWIGGRRRAKVLPKYVAAGFS